MTIFAAIRFASAAHTGQCREDGTPYIEHPLAVLRYLWQCSMDLPFEAYVAAILHDVLEDTHVTYKDILETAGADVAAMVRALTKDDAYYALNPNVREYAYLHRLEEISAVYPSVLLIKMMDRLHNIQTAEALPLERRRRLFIETQEIYLPFFADCLYRKTHWYGTPFHYCLERLGHAVCTTPALSTV